MLDSALQAEGQEFDSPMLHSMKSGFLFGGAGLFLRGGVQGSNWLRSQLSSIQTVVSVDGCAGLDGRKS